MQIISIGFLRTGTTSMKLALEELGFGPCYHLKELVNEPSRAAEWLTVAEDPASADWKQLYADYNSAVGTPTTTFWRYVIEAFPDAKVIVTVRDPNEWYDSATRTIGEALEPPLPVRLLTWRPRREPDLLDAVQRIARQHEGGQVTDREEAVAAFEQHLADVRAHVPADRLLFYRVRDGWGPLCAFLGVPEPVTPFPRENDRATFRRRIRKGVTRVIARRAVGAVVVAGAVALAVWATRRPR
ncbi:sulfotransferase family protein [Micromonospora sp. NPDC047074]|uniref:sulfotransferase family protein n=1 Tax=Micromonospora sp. NPDC047074 TaxID=3154339 RepID=UPI0033CDD796